MRDNLKNTLPQINKNLTSIFFGTFVQNFISLEIVTNDVMVQIEEQGNIIYTVATHQLDDEDYQKIIPAIKEKVKNYTMVRWYFEMHDFEGWSLGALWKDLKLDFQNRNNFEKIAMVGSKKWEEKLTDLMKPFTDADIRFFDLGQKEEARTWINKTN